MVKERSTRRASGDEAEGTDLPVEKGKFLFKAAVEADGSGGNPAKGRRDERWRRVLVRRVFGSACVWFGVCLVRHVWFGVFGLRGRREAHRCCGHEARDAEGGRDGLLEDWMDCGLACPVRTLQLRRTRTAPLRVLEQRNRSLSTRVADEHAPRVPSTQQPLQSDEIPLVNLRHAHLNSRAEQPRREERRTTVTLYI